MGRCALANGRGHEARLHYDAQDCAFFGKRSPDCFFRGSLVSIIAGDWLLCSLRSSAWGHGCLWKGAGICFPFPLGFASVSQAIMDEGGAASREIEAFASGWTLRVLRQADAHFECGRSISRSQQIDEAAQAALLWQALCGPVPWRLAPRQAEELAHQASRSALLFALLPDVEVGLLHMFLRLVPSDRRSAVARTSEERRAIGRPGWRTLLWLGRYIAGT